MIFIEHKMIYVKLFKFIRRRRPKYTKKEDRFKKVKNLI